MRTHPVLRIHPVPTHALGPHDVDRMWRLYADFYDHVDRPTFERDLAEKALVFMGTDAATGVLVGFSTALIFPYTYADRRLGIYFSGDTIIRPQYWGQVALHRAVLGHLMRWKLRHPAMPLYWYLLCSGYRTYLTLVRNFSTHWPHHERPTPPWERGLIDSVGRARFGSAWQADRGLVSWGSDQPVLKARVAPLTPELLTLPELAFFQRANPGYAQGDELAVIAPVRVGAACRMVAKWLRKTVRAGREPRRPALGPIESTP